MEATLLAKEWPPPVSCLPASDGSATALRRILLLLPIVALLGALIFLLTWDVPAPTRSIEQPIADERLPR